MGTFKLIKDVTQRRGLGESKGISRHQGMRPPLGHKCVSKIINICVSSFIVSCRGFVQRGVKD